MINYSRSKIYFIRRQDTGEVIWSGGTISNLSRRYYNHKSNEKDCLNKIAKEQNLDWRNLKIELIKDYDTCRDRKTLKFVAETAHTYLRQNNPEVLDHFLNNVDYFIE